MVLSGLPGVGPMALSSVLRIPQIADKDLEEIGRANPAVAKALAQPGALDAAEERAAKNLRTAQADGAMVLSPADAGYPRLLAETHDRPVFLYVKGDLEPTRERPVGVIGTREPTEHGQIIARRVTSYFAEKGWSIVSGLALGIDGIAHEAALEAKGHTVAVLAHGLDTITPKRHTKLAERILASGGAWVTEYPYGTAPYGPNYVKRDRIQAGLSKAIILIQTDVQGGSLHATRAALGYGRVVAYPVPTRTDIDRGEPKIQGVLKLHHAPRAEVADYLRCSLDALAGLRPIGSKAEYPVLEWTIFHWEGSRRVPAADLFDQPRSETVRGGTIR
ncbi:DNA-processing protein DprA [Longimicrobium sp.]|uniref:DNA-processing protein DprA n=1 Tax=Longimicrobium sp. TaxID=2029185 RepID=UPI002E2F4B93|nr:DNA-processing protein DprA [Longimicrobium sp.]HEX6037773.1 DNA-processing protein DprA [Longimicrobium sp.]